jgi:type II secretory pathway pseudopilin PulG
MILFFDHAGMLVNGRIQVRKVIVIVLCIMLASPVFTQAQNAGGVAPQSRPSTSSAAKNSFQEVTSHLDPGGNLYLYLSTEEWINGLSGQISQLRDLANAVPSTSDDKQNTARLFDALTKLVKQSGIEQISGFGISSVAVEKGLYRTKWMLHHYKGNDSGYLWSAMGRQPHALDGLDLLPANTAFAWFSDLDLPLLFSIFTNDIGASGILGPQLTAQTLRAQFSAMTGGDLDKAIASIGNECGLAVTLDENSAVNPRLPGPAGQIPDIGLMLICKVKNDMIFDLVDSNLKANRQIIRTDRSDLRMRTMPLPAMGSPIKLRTSVARSGDYLFVASTDALIEAAVAVKAGKSPGLKSTEEFKKVSQGTPDQGNSFSFRSQKIAQTIARLQSQVLPSTTTNNPSQKPMLANLFGTPGTPGTYQVAANTAEGWFALGNSGQNPATTLFLLPTIATILITGSVAIPSLVRSRQTANDAAVVANLKAIATAETSYFSSRGSYVDMQTLVQAGLLDSRYMSPLGGYNFVISALPRRYTASATPASPGNGRYAYFVTADSIVRYSGDPAQAPSGLAGKPVQ